MLGGQGRAARMAQACPSCGIHGPAGAGAADLDDAFTSVFTAARLAPQLHELHRAAQQFSVADGDGRGTMPGQPGGPTAVTAGTWILVNRERACREVPIGTRPRRADGFASFAGVAPIPASSGLANKHRLKRGGDRQLNGAMHTITLIRMRLGPATKTYVARRVNEGKSPRDAQRCLKRNISRQIFKILERRTQPDAEELPHAA
ncbi:transposase [Streptomyces sp. NPDC052015]|uniref:transposase n=1 Tax=Streptomyces sp. NPDC052015 TaxID=3154755 RepID=UPI003418EEE8